MALKQVLKRERNMKYPMDKRSVSFGALALAAVVLAGCGGGTPPVAAGGASQDSTSSTSSVTYTPKGVDAGLPVDVSTDTKPYTALVAASARFGHRGDPFQLTAEEAAYDKKQNVERVLNSIGGFSTEYELPIEETKNVEQQEPQPYRRLAGIIIGDSVLALIDMGNGQATTIIRPGMKIPNTEWTVVSINEDRAILHRDGTVGPHTISVRLESPPPGFSSAPTGFGAAPNRPAGGGGNRPRMGTSGGNPGNSGAG
jgi:hypothetical protein